jgi:hypothetical protein
VCDGALAVRAAVSSKYSTRDPLPPAGCWYLESGMVGEMDCTARIRLLRCVPRSLVDVPVGSRGFPWILRSFLRVDGPDMMVQSSLSQQYVLMLPCRICMLHAAAALRDPAHITAVSIFFNVSINCPSAASSMGLYEPRSCCWHSCCCCWLLLLLAAAAASAAAPPPPSGGRWVSRTHNTSTAGGEGYNSSNGTWRG